MKLSTAFALLGAASTAFPGVSAHEVAALRGFLPENIDFLGNQANCNNVASGGCRRNSEGADRGVNSCDNLQNSGCGCRWNSSGDFCAEDSCSSITSTNAAQDVCNSRSDCSWNGNNCHNNGNGNGNSNKSCKGRNSQDCADANGCTYIVPTNGNGNSCVSVVDAGDYCVSSPRNQNQNKCVKAGCEWYPVSGSNSYYCDIPCSYYDGNKSQCGKSGCSYNKGNNLCETPNYVFDFEAALESSN